MDATESNRLCRAVALQRELEKRGKTPRAARLADKVFGTANGCSKWNWAGLYYRAALLTKSWGRHHTARVMSVWFAENRSLDYTSATKQAECLFDVPYHQAVEGWVNSRLDAKHEASI